MALRLEQKKAVVANVNALANTALSVVVADYCGLTMGDMTEIRAKALTQGVHVQVVKNTLAKRAFVETPMDCLSESLSGQMILFFSIEHPGAAAKLAKEFAKRFDALEVKALAFDGQMMAANQLDMLANIPTHEEALSLLMAVMLAPVSQVARATSETLGRLVRVTSAYAESQGNNG